MAGLFFAGRHGQQLSYELDLRTPDSRDVAVCCHGMMCTKRTATLLHITEGLRVNTFRFDLSGNGESPGEFTLAGYERETEELKDAVDFCRREGFRVTALIGHSKGAQVVIMYSAVYGDVPIIVSLAPRYDMSQCNRVVVPYLQQIESEGFAVISYHKKEYRITKAMLTERTALDMGDYSRRAVNWVLLLHCQEDEVTPVADAYRYKEALGDHLLKLVVLPGGSHYFLEEQAAMAADAINEFFDQMVPVYNLRGTV